MKKLTVGIDVSKDKLDFCILNNRDHSVLSRGIIPNTKDDISAWLAQLTPHQHALAMEHTGHYGALLSCLLSANHMCFYMINPLELKKSMALQRGKTDAVDAYRSASYAIAQAHRLKPYTLPTASLRKIKALISARERFVKISVQLQNSLKSNLILHKTIDIQALIDEEKRQIKSIRKSIRAVEHQMKNLIASSQELHESYQKITKVIGVGPITAIKCIVETDNFLKFPNGRKFSCHCGLAPFPYQSGSSVKGKSKTHYLRDKALKGILFKAAGSAIQHDPQLKTYYNRKLKEGKHKLSALNAVANKLVLRIFAVAKRDEPFVKLVA